MGRAWLLWGVCGCLSWAAACFDGGPRNSGPGIDPPKGKEPVRFDAGLPQSGGSSTTSNPTAKSDAGRTTSIGSPGGADAAPPTMTPGAAGSGANASTGGVGGAADSDAGPP